MRKKIKKKLSPLSVILIEKAWRRAMASGPLERGGRSLLYLVYCSEGEEDSKDQDKEESWKEEAYREEG